MLAAVEVRGGQEGGLEEGGGGVLRGLGCCCEGGGEVHYVFLGDGVGMGWLGLCWSVGCVGRRGGWRYSVKLGLRTICSLK